MDTNLATQPQVKRSWSTGMAFSVSAVLAFGGSLVVMLVVGQILQPRELAAEEKMVTVVAQQPQLPDLPSGHAYREEVAVVSHDIAALPGSTNHSLSIDHGDYSPEATTASLTGRSVLRRRKRRRSKRPQTTVATPAAAIDNSPVVETTPWLN
ncbi:hypothetical protein MTO96_036177 [Rhipicephalus appendiculatus]